MTDPLPPAALLASFGISALATAAQWVGETGHARVWKLRGPDGRWAALKDYTRGDHGNEAAGFDWMATQDEGLVAQIYQRTPSAALIEWLDGPSLGDMSRGGQDPEACETLAELAGALHKGPQTCSSRMPHLSSWLDDLFALTFAPDCPSSLRADVKAAQALARDLLRTSPEPRALHGDLHHDNVIMTKTGARAFDAKGVWGEPAYELANAFRNPKGMGDRLRDEARIMKLADLAAAKLHAPKDRILDWAAAKSALSIAWCCGGTLSQSGEAALLTRLLEARVR